MSSDLRLLLLTDAERQVYEAIKGAGRNELTPKDIAEKSGLAIELVKTCCLALLKPTVAFVRKSGRRYVAAEIEGKA